MEDNTQVLLDRLDNLYAVLRNRLTSADMKIISDIVEIELELEGRSNA